MITYLKFKIQPFLFATLLCLGCFQSGQAQVPTLNVVMDSSCNLTISLQDTSSNIVSHNPPYLFSIAGINSNSNSLGAATIDLSNVTNGSYVVQVIDGNQDIYSSTYLLTCGLNNTNQGPVLLDSVDNASNCNTCNGIGTVYVQNPIGGQYLFTWNDGTTFTDPSLTSRGGLCPGAYNVVVTDPNNQSSTINLFIGCNNSNPPATATCNQFLTVDVGNSTNNTLSPQDLSTQALLQLPLTQAYLVDDIGTIQNSVTYNCNDLGYHYLTLLFVDSVLQTADTCQTLVQVVDSSGLCNGYNPHLVISSTTNDASTCGACDGTWFSSGLIDTTTNVFSPVSFTYAWNDGFNGGPTRAQLCANQLYSVTVTDSVGNSYSESFVLSCNVGQNCIDTSLIDSLIPCPTTYTPVCGCNNITYLNSCVAQYEYGLTSWTQGACSQNDITVILNSTPATCDSTSIYNTGTITATAYGGVGGYTYSWPHDTTITTTTVTGLSNGSYTVIVSDNNGNMTFATGFVGLDNCVWPGDADDNTVANNFDLLPIAIAYGDTGYARNQQDILWYAHHARSWTNTPFNNLPNHKHFDADGSGSIDSLDLFATLQNYGESYFRSAMTSLFGPAPFMIQNTTASPGDTVTVPILLGNQTFPITNGYAVAFTINYDPTVVEANSISADFNSSWLGTNLIDIQKDFHASGKIELAVGRTDKLPIASGAGQLGSISFTIKDDVWIGKSVPSDSTITSPFTISDIRLIDQRNGEIGTNPQTGTIIISPRTSINKINNQLDIQLFPNPAKDVLHIRSGTAEIQSIRLFTAAGQLVQEKSTTEVYQEQLSMGNLPNGIYFISIQTNRGIYNNRLQVLR